MKIINDMVLKPFFYTKRIIQLPLYSTSKPIKTISDRFQRRPSLHNTYIVQCPHFQKSYYQDGHPLYSLYTVLLCKDIGGVFYDPIRLEQVPNIYYIQESVDGEKDFASKETHINWDTHDN